MFLIDASPAMLEPAPAPVAASIPGAAPRSRTYLDVAVECAHGMLRSRIVSAPGTSRASSSSTPARVAVWTTPPAA